MRLRLFCIYGVELNTPSVLLAPSQKYFGERQNQVSGMDSGWSKLIVYLYSYKKRNTEAYRTIMKRLTVKAHEKSQ